MKPLDEERISGLQTQHIAKKFYSANGAHSELSSTANDSDFGMS